VPRAARPMSARPSRIRSMRSMLPTLSWLMSLLFEWSMKR
jgi:hypothetical protein